MNGELLQELAGDSRFIPGIYNYCDRWCERCPLSHRCLNYASEQAEDDPFGTGQLPEPQTRDHSNEKFRDKYRGNLQDTLEMLRLEARNRGIDLDDPELQAAVKAQERAERRLAAKNRPLAKRAMAYVNA